MKRPLQKILGHFDRLVTCAIIAIGFAVTIWLYYLGNDVVAAKLGNTKDWAWDAVATMSAFAAAEFAVLGLTEIMRSSAMNTPEGSRHPFSRIVKSPHWSTFIEVLVFSLILSTLATLVTFLSWIAPQLSPLSIGRDS